MSYLMENNLPYGYQSGFRKNHRMNTFLSYFAHKILAGFDSSVLNVMVLISLQKAFDTINHKILLKR